MRLLIVVALAICSIVDVALAEPIDIEIDYKIDASAARARDALNAVPDSSVPIGLKIHTKVNEVQVNQAQQVLGVNRELMREQTALRTRR